MATRLGMAIGAALAILAGTETGLASEKVTLFADMGMVDCSIADTGTGVVEVYIFHVGIGGRTAVEFLAPKPDCWTGAVWVGDVGAPGFGVLGSSQAVDMSVAYGLCLQLPVYVGKINYFVTGAAQGCCVYPVLPTTFVFPPLPQSALTVDCSFETLIPIGTGSAVINPTPNCPCEQPVASERTTWGAVKALYD